ncbi:substrate-binding domain-containing protein [Serinibacter arcticus]|uniref:substrate-binding domain-containing protein n=1 Tax=Serinibacter arcticus TaxID=1655435 RepID=UPI003AF32DC4
MRDRRTGFVAEHAHHHVPHDPANEFRATRSTVPGSHATPDDDVRALVGYLTDRPDLQAVVVTEYHLAVLVREADEQVGLRVPQDLSIVCFDHPGRLFDRGSFEFTHIEQDEAAMGTEAVRIARELVADRGRVQRVALETRLVVGGSTVDVRR